MREGDLKKLSQKLVMLIGYLWLCSLMHYRHFHFTTEFHLSLLSIIIFFNFLLSLLLTPSWLFFHGFMRWWEFILMLWDFSFLFFSPSLLLTSLKESFKPTNKKNIYFGRAGRGEDKAIIWEGRDNVGLWEGGRRELIKKQRHICKLPFSTFRSLQAVFPVWMCVWMCVHMYVDTDVCAQACFLGRGAGEGGFVMSFVEREHRWHLTGSVLGGIAGFCLLIATLWGWSPSLY